MSIVKHQLSAIVNGVEVPISPITDSSSINYNNQQLDEYLEDNVPEVISIEEYNQMVEDGEITEETTKLYIVHGDTEDPSGTISDNTVSGQTTFSSRKILELVSNRQSSDIGTGGTSSMDVIKATLNISGWTGKTAPYTYSLLVDNVTENSFVSVNMDNSLSRESYEEQYKSAGSAFIKRIAQSDGVLTFYAYGVKPKIPINLTITIQN